MTSRSAIKTAAIIMTVVIGVSTSGCRSSTAAGDGRPPSSIVSQAATDAQHTAIQQSRSIPDDVKARILANRQPQPRQ